jgi:hypothetical protein
MKPPQGQVCANSGEGGVGVNNPLDSFMTLSTKTFEN